MVVELHEPPSVWKLHLFLSKEFKNQMISHTNIDKQNSNDELRFIARTGGIGGFYKLEDNANWNWILDKFMFIVFILLIILIRFIPFKYHLRIH